MPLKPWAMALLGLSLFATGASTLAQNHKGHHDHAFSGAEKWSQVFDDPKRDAWQKPQEVIKALSLKSGAVIVDIGAGTGYFSTRFAKAVPQSRVYGVDAEPDMVRFLGERARKENLGNLKAVAANAADPRLPEKADMIVMVDVFHHIDARTRYFRNLRDSLLPGGRVAIIDFRLDTPYGPARASRIAPERVIAELKEAGYTLQETHEFLPRQYFLVFKPAV